MSERVTLMMGDFAAEFPVDRHYAQNHMWAQLRGDVYRCGFSAYAVRLLQDVYFLDWNVDVETDVSEKQSMGVIESKKAESSLHAPMAGKLLRFNDLLLADPSYINLSPYDTGWLFEIQPTDPQLLSAGDYLRHASEVWKVTQATLKGRWR